MAGWLLGPHAFSELVAGQTAGHRNALMEWSRTIQDGLYVTELTVAYVRSVAQLKPPRDRMAWLAELDGQVPIKFGSNLLPVSRAHWIRWSEVRLELDPQGRELSFTESVDVAVCLVEDFGYVSPSVHLGSIVQPFKTL